MQELAIASVPMQIYRSLYTPAQAMQRGTIFAELDKPWAPEKAKKEGCSNGSRHETTDGSCVCRG